MITQIREHLLHKTYELFRGVLGGSGERNEQQSLTNRHPSKNL